MMTETVPEIVPETVKSTLDVEKVRADFPILQRTVHNKPLVYFDTAASAQRLARKLRKITNRPV